MKCPKCRCEVGNQPVCPYCGATVYIGNNTWSASDYARRATTKVMANARVPQENEGLESRIRNLETKLNLILVMQGGAFALTVLVLFVLAIK